MNTQLALGLPAAAPSNTVVINARCTLRAEEDQRVVVVGGLPVFHYCATDVIAEAYAMVMLVDSGSHNKQRLHVRSASLSERRYQERYVQRGMAGWNGQKVGVVVDVVFQGSGCVTSRDSRARV